MNCFSFFVIFNDADLLLLHHHCSAAFEFEYFSISSSKDPSSHLNPCLWSLFIISLVCFERKGNPYCLHDNGTGFLVFQDWVLHYFVPPPYYFLRLPFCFLQNVRTLLNRLCFLLYFFILQ